jgi:hypothetical protein
MIYYSYTCKLKKRNGRANKVCAAHIVEALTQTAPPIVPIAVAI